MLHCISIPFWGLLLCKKYIRRELSFEQHIFQFPSGDYFYARRLLLRKRKPSNITHFNSLLGITSMQGRARRARRPRRAWRISIPFWGLLLCKLMECNQDVYRSVTISIPFWGLLLCKGAPFERAYIIFVTFQFPSGDYFYARRPATWGIRATRTYFNSLLGITSMQVALWEIRSESCQVISIPFWGLLLCKALSSAFGIAISGIISIPFWGLLLCKLFVVSYRRRLITPPFQFPSGDYFYASKWGVYCIFVSTYHFNSLLGITSMQENFHGE